MNFSLKIFILLGILILVYFIFKENDKINNEDENEDEDKDKNNIKKNTKKKIKNKIKSISKDSLIEKYNDTLSEKINYDEESSNESIFDNNENYDNVFYNFIESREFKGEKNGYIFKNGGKGLGYYVDRFKKCLNSEYIYICTDPRFDFDFLD